MNERLADIRFMLEAHTNSLHNTKATAQIIAKAADHFTRAQYDYDSGHRLAHEFEALRIAPETVRLAASIRPCGFLQGLGDGLAELRQLRAPHLLGASRFPAASLSVGWGSAPLHYAVPPAGPLAPDFFANNGAQMWPSNGAPVGPFAPHVQSYTPPFLPASPLERPVQPAGPHFHSALQAPGYQAPRHLTPDIPASASPRPETPQVAPLRLFAESSSPTISTPSARTTRAYAGYVKTPVTGTLPDARVQSERSDHMTTPVTPPQREPEGDQNVRRRIDILPPPEHDNPVKSVTLSPDIDECPIPARDELSKPSPKNKRHQKLVKYPHNPPAIDRSFVLHLVEPRTARNLQGTLRGRKQTEQPKSQSPGITAKHINGSPDYRGPSAPHHQAIGKHGASPTQKKQPERQVMTR